MTLWVFVHGRSAESGRGAEVEVVEARRRGRAEQGGSGGYWWATFPELKPGSYTVRVRFPNGGTRTGRVTLAAGSDQIRFDEAI